METLHLTRTTSRPATDTPLNHTPRPTLPPMTKDPFLLQTLPPPPPSPTKSRIADIFHRRRQASRQEQQQQQTYPHPPTSMPTATVTFTNPTREDVEMAALAGPQPHAKNTDSTTSTSMGTPKSPHHPAAAPPPATVSFSLNGHRSAPVVSSSRGGKAAAGYRGSLLEGVRYSAGGEPVGWYEMFEKTRKFEGGFVETKEGGVRCIHPCAWGEDELGEYVSGGASGGGGGGASGGGGWWGARGSEAPGHGSGGDGAAPPYHPQGADHGGWGGNIGAHGGGNIGAQAGGNIGPHGGGMNRADSETLGSGRFGETMLPSESRSAALRAGLIGLDGGDGGEDEDGDEDEGGPSRGGSNTMEMIKVILDEGPPPDAIGGGMSRVR